MKLSHANFIDANLALYAALGKHEDDLNIHYAPPSKSSLRVGVVVFGQDQVQLVDLAALDLLAMLGRNRISRLEPSTDAMDEAVDEIDIRFVSVTGSGSFPVTSGSRMPVTPSESQSGGEVKVNTYPIPILRQRRLDLKNNRLTAFQNSFENAPQFDILYIPGSFSSNELPVSATSFITEQCANPNLVAVMSIGSGIALSTDWRFAQYPSSSTTLPTPGTATTVPRDYMAAVFLGAP
ncbi:hypothetical protein N0V83_008808 [Neocucurbitaria cava]|uniref:Uncharacterized protein n=1 Tax=Neocucurbitaria cava TaxID=798079 RepID=A0A9W9CJ15_9PLEO|nr:hypothetical protein N0V83_008808 [Neocucurbitaria cava]